MTPDPVLALTIPKLTLSVCDAPKICVSEQAFGDKVTREAERRCRKALVSADMTKAALEGEARCIAKLNQCAGQLQTMTGVSGDRDRWMIRAEKYKSESESKWSTVSIVVISAVAIVVGGGLGYLGGKIF